MYLDAGFEDFEAQRIKATFSGTFERRWNIKVTQFACGSLSAPPPGCLNYVTGVSGRVRSFNFVVDGGVPSVSKAYDERRSKLQANLIIISPLRRYSSFISIVNSTPCVYDRRRDIVASDGKSRRMISRSNSQGKRRGKIRPDLGSVS